MNEISFYTFFEFKKTELAGNHNARVCILCSLRKQKCRLKSTTINGWLRFGQSEQRKSSELFPIQSKKSPDSGFFACDHALLPKTDYRDKGREHDRRLMAG